MCTPFPASSGSSSGAKLTRAPARRAISRTTSFRTTLRSAAAIPCGGGHRNLELVGGVLREEQFGLNARFCEGAHDQRAERIDASLRLQGKGRRRRCLAEELELVLEARHHADTELALELIESVTQEPPRTALPRRAVGLDDVAQHELQGALTRSPLDANPASRCRAAVAGRPPSQTGCPRARAPSGVIDELAGTHPTPACSRALSSGVGSERPRTIEPRSQQTSATSSAELKSASPP